MKNHRLFIYTYIIYLVIFIDIHSKKKTLFNHPTTDIQLEKKLQLEGFSDAFKVTLIVIRLYSLVHKKHPIDIYSSNWSMQIYKWSDSLKVNLHRLVDPGNCVYNWGTWGCPNWKLILFQDGRRCTSILKFNDVAEQFSFRKLAIKNRNRIIVAYVMRTAVTEKGIFTFELAVILKLKRVSGDKKSGVYECVYINTFNEIKSMEFEIRRGRFLVLGIIFGKYNDIIHNKVTLYRSYVVRIDNTYQVTFHKFSFQMSGDLERRSSMLSDLEFMNCLIIDDSIVEELKLSDQSDKSTYIKMLNQVDVELCDNHVSENTVNVIVPSSPGYTRKEILEFYFGNIIKIAHTQSQLFLIYLCIENTHIKYARLHSDEFIDNRSLENSCLSFDLTLRISPKRNHISVKASKLRNLLFEAGSKGNLQIVENGKEFSIDENGKVVTGTCSNEIIQEILNKEKQNNSSTKIRKIVLIEQYIMKIFNPINGYFDFSNLTPNNKKTYFQGKEIKIELQEGLHIKHKEDDCTSTFTGIVENNNDEIGWDTIIGLSVLLVFITIFTTYAIIFSSSFRKDRECFKMGLYRKRINYYNEY